MIQPVILCGGSGTRLWPLSRQCYPKQFLPFFDNQTLFQSAALRLDCSDFNAPLIVTNEAFRFIAAQQLQDVGIRPRAILLEPTARNTAPAVLAAALHTDAVAPGALLLISPSDQLIPDTDAFRRTVENGIDRAVAGDIVTFGVEPDRPETGYGYLELSDTGVDDVAGLVGFVEKPDAETAQKMVEDGQHLWNSGIFLARADRLIDAFSRYAPDVAVAVNTAISMAQSDLDFVRLEAQAWNQAPSISLDHAVMERADRLAVVPFREKWSDLGSWEGVWRAAEVNETGVAQSGPTTEISCENVLLRSEHDELEVVGIGLRDTIVVAMKDAVLVADTARSQDVKLALTKLQGKAARQATHLPRDHRPWGWFETVAIGERHRVKKIVVYPGASLSLQSHVHRAEHWIVVAGSAQVTIGTESALLAENQSIFVPLGAVHRLENPGKVDLHLIEVQTGSYLGEDDIVRYDDVYNRDAAE